MSKNVLTLMITLTVSLINTQTSDVFTAKHIDSEPGIKNVNIVIPKLDTTLVTDNNRNYRFLWITEYRYINN